MGAAQVVSVGGCLARRPRRSAGDQFAVGVVAHHERVLADDLEAVARVEALRPVVFAPYADPQSPGSVALEPLERRGE